jgi:hypothetical protein
MKFVYTFVAVALVVPVNAAQAAETVIHHYDALGRLIQSTKSGGPLGGGRAATSFDLALNRSCQSTTGVHSGPSAPTCRPPR